MKPIKLNRNWGVESHHPAIELDSMAGRVKLSFSLDSQRYEHVAENEKGLLMFQDVYAYRLIEMTGEEYNNGHTRFSSTKIQWGGLYELQKSTWKKDFPKDHVVLNKDIDKKKLIHYLFTIKGNLFECLANEYTFRYEEDDAEYIEEYYPKGYFSHYITMFRMHFDTCTKEDFKQYTALYVQMQSEKELQGLKEEIRSIKRNADTLRFLKLVNLGDIEGFGMKQLEGMLSVIINYKL